MNLADFQGKVARNIRKYRLKRGWTQFDMTEFGFSLRQYQYIEAGERNVSLKTILKLAKVFKIAPDRLLK
ncbi:MAG: helix-turn-helix transcriptional regulator [Deltaproteobacteria bacterium]|nr:helix-turn-helix transcriptional regulator [Deltaproteobacteria bacterium]